MDYSKFTPFGNIKCETKVTCMKVISDSAIIFGLDNGKLGYWDLNSNS